MTLTLEQLEARDCPAASPVESAFAADVAARWPGYSPILDARIGFVAHERAEQLAKPVAGGMAPLDPAPAWIKRALAGRGYQSIGFGEGLARATNQADAIAQVFARNDLVTGSKVHYGVGQVADVWVVISSVAPEFGSFSTPKKKSPL